MKTKKLPLLDWLLLSNFYSTAQTQFYHLHGKLPVERKEYGLVPAADV